MVLLECMCGLMKVFDDACAKSGKKTLTKGELKALLQEELGGLGAGQEVKNQAGADKLLDDLDLNGDNMIDFNEFVILVTTFTCFLYNIIEED